MGKRSRVNTITYEKIDSSSVDEELFCKAVNTYIGRTQGLMGIGTLSEKTVHAALKYYYSPNEKYHEIKIGKNVADICMDGEIYEIQSRSFNKLRSKLSLFLDEYEVTVIYPVPVNIYLKYIEPSTGEISSARTSSKHGNLYDIITELYYIKMLLNNPHLHFLICFIDMEEYKLLDGYDKTRKRKATKTDRIPVKICGEFRINSKEDYLNLLPGFKNGKLIDNDLKEIYQDFTSKDIALLLGISIQKAGILLNIYNYLGLIEKTGSKNRYYSYHLIDN